jgi:hypothetical protein
VLFNRRRHGSINSWTPHTHTPENGEIMKDVLLDIVGIICIIAIPALIMFYSVAFGFA